MGDEDEYYYEDDSSWWDSFIPDWDTVTDWGGQAWDYVTDTNIVGGSGGSGLIDDLYGLITDDRGNIDTGKIAAGASGIASLAGMLGLIDTDSSDDRPTGYQGKIPEYTAVRQRVGDTYDPTRRPGSGGQRYFSDVAYVAPENVGAAQESAIQQAATLRQQNIDNPAQQRPVASQPVAMMRGGIARLQGGGTPAQAPVGPMSRQDLISLYETNPREAFRMIMSGEVGGKPQSMSYARTYLEKLKKAQAAGQLPSQQQPAPQMQTPPMGSGMAQGGIARLQGGGHLSQQDKAAAAYGELDRKTAEMTEQGITSEFTYGGNKIINFENEEAKAAYEISEILRKLRAGEITIEQAEEFMRQNQPPQQIPQSVQPMGSGMAQGGIASMKPKGYYLGGTTDGMADKVPATIDNQQPAALSDGEFVVPADVVSHLGNGNSNAGAQQLYSMMDNIRQARTGNKQQGKQINPNKFMPA